MGASKFEQDLAQTGGVTIHHWAQPLRVQGSNSVSSVEFEKTALDKKGKLSGTGDTFSLEADVLFKAIGQKLALNEATQLELQNGKIIVDEHQATSLVGIWAGGDSVVGGDDLTVSAVQHGKIAAIAIDRHLRA